MIVVSNTSPIINLAAIGQIDLLRRLYSRVIIPQAVYDEIISAGAGQPGVEEVRSAEWIETRRATDRIVIAALQTELDDGEAEAIALAIELNADLLLLDERKARRIASQLGLRFIGILGALVEAKHQGIISAARPVVDDLITRAGFWISRDLYERLLRAVEE